MTDKGNPRGEFFEAVGECLHAWGFVELEIANLYMIAHGIRRDWYSHPTRAAFEAVISLEVRLAMIGAYVEADGLLEKYRPHVKALNSKVLKLYKKRHAVAHFLVAAEMQGDRILVHTLRPFLTMSRLDRDRGKALTIAQVRERKISFDRLADRVRQHVQHVGQTRGLPAEFYARPGEIAFPPLESEDLTQSEPQHPPQSSEE